MNKAKKTQKESKRKYTGKKNEGHSATSKEGSKGSSILAGKPHKLKPDKGLAVPVTLT
jgi:hypothetical protein